jgi:hypothetical protein
MAAPSSSPAANYPAPKPKYIRAAYLSQGEAMLRETRATLLYYLPGPVFGLLVALVLDYGFYSAEHGWPAIPGITSGFASIEGHLAGLSMSVLRIVLLLITLLLVLWLLVRYLRWVRTAYAVTTSRVIVQRGLISRDFDEIPVFKVRAVDVHQTGVQRLLGYGTVRISSEGENRIANEAWLGIPKPWEFSKLVDAAAQRYMAPR